MSVGRIILFCLGLGLGFGQACTLREVRDSEVRIEGHELIYAFAGPMGAFIGGLRGSVEANAEIVIKSGDQVMLLQVTADEMGRFHAPLTVEANDLITVEVASLPPVDFRVRDFEIAHREAVWPPIEGLGHVLNDLLVLGSKDDAYGIIVRSGDNAVSKIDLKSGLGSGVRLPELTGSNGRKFPANPWFIKSVSSDRVFVTAFGQDKVYLVDLSTEEIIQTLQVTEPVVLPEPYVLPRAIDIDLDGVLESRVTQYLPRSPQSLFVTSEQLVVAYSGFVSARLDSSRPAVYLPAVLVFWSLVDQNKSPQYLVLAHRNPQEISLSNDQQLLVTCSGVIESIDGVLQTTSDSAVIKVDPQKREIIEVYELGNFGASSTVDVDGKIWTSSLLRAQLRRVDTGEVLTLNEETTDSIFRLEKLPGKLIAAPSFNTDRVHIVDAYTGQLNPPPFLQAFVVGPGRPVFDGAQIIARREGRAGVDFVGPDLFCLSGIASRITPIETRKLLGP